MAILHYSFWHSHSVPSVISSILGSDYSLLFSPSKSLLRHPLKLLNSSELPSNHVTKDIALANHYSLGPFVFLPAQKSPICKSLTIFKLHGGNVFKLVNKATDLGQGTKIDFLVPIPTLDVNWACGFLNELFEGQSLKWLGPFSFYSPTSMLLCWNEQLQNAEESSSNMEVLEMCSYFHKIKRLTGQSKTWLCVGRNWSMIAGNWLCFSALYLQFLPHSGTKIFAESGLGERVSETLDLACTRWAVRSLLTEIV